MKIETLPLAKIAAGERLRALDADWVAALALSIDETGLQAPIVVGPANKHGKHPLISGAHRLAAVERLDWTEVPAIVMNAGDARRRLMEIDENLVRRELSALDRAAFLAERKDVYEGLHPETKRGKAGALARWHANAKFSFASNVAKKLKVSTRHVEQAVRLHRLLAPVRARLAGTWLADKGSALAALSRLEPEDLTRAVELLLSEDGPKTVAAAYDRIHGPRRAASDPREAAFDRLVAAWGRADFMTRKRFMVFAEKSMRPKLVKSDRPGTGVSD